MATRNIVRTARNANKDLAISFFFSDASATPPNAPHAMVSVVSDAPGEDPQTKTYTIAIANSTLSAVNKTAMAAALRTLFDEAVAAIGFA